MRGDRRSPRAALEQVVYWLMSRTTSRSLACIPVRFVRRRPAGDRLRRGGSDGLAGPHANDMQVKVAVNESPRVRFVTPGMARFDLRVEALDDEQGRERSMIEGWVTNVRSITPSQRLGSININLIFGGVACQIKNPSRNLRRGN